MSISRLVLSRLIETDIKIMNWLSFDICIVVNIILIKLLLYIIYILIGSNG
jgi:hypothetical protein